MGDFLKKPLVILEMANNHMGEVAHGKALIDTITGAVAPFREYFDFAVKYQFRDLETFIHPAYKGSSLKFVKRFEETALTDEDWQQLIAYGRSKDFLLIITPFDEPSVERVVKFDVDFVKVASCSLADWPLIEKIAKTSKPVIFSTAGATLENIDSMVAFFANRSIDIVMMHCVGLYPTPVGELNLGQISYYKARYPGLEIGYSTHEDPTCTNTGGIAYSLGARAFEKHVALEANGHAKNAYSASGKDIFNWLTELKAALEIVGEQESKVKNTEAEILHLRELQRAMFAKKDIPANSVITEDDVYFAIPYTDGDYVANDFSKYTTFKTNQKIPANNSVNKSNCEVVNARQDVLGIVRKVSAFVASSGIVLPKNATLEISHHYGLERFYEIGLAMVTVVNVEYCKKVLILLPGQSHPEQYHKKKKETFSVVHGSIELILDGKKINVRPGDVITIDPGVRHAFSTFEGCVIEEISSSHYVDDSYYSDPSIMENDDRKSFINFWTSVD